MAEFAVGEDGVAINISVGTEQAIKALSSLSKQFRLFSQQIEALAPRVGRSWDKLFNINDTVSANSSNAIVSRLQGISNQIKPFAKDVANSMSSSAVSSKELMDVHKTMGDTIMNSANQQKQYWDNYFKNNTKAVKVTTDSLKNSRQEFAGWALSIMFFGMALKNTFNTIWRSSTKTFNDVMHSVEGSVTQFDMLAGSLDYLKFNVGQAIEPLAAALIPIIDFVSELVNRFPTLTATIVTALGVGGTIITAIGFGTLAWNGFAEAIGLAKTNAQGLKSYDWEGLKSSISKAAGVVAIGFALEEAKDAYDALSNGEVADGIISALSAGFTGYGGIRLLQGKKGGAALIAVGIALDLVEEDKLFKTLFSTIGIITAVIATLIDRIKFMFKQGIRDGIIDGAILAIKSMAGILGNTLINGLFGSDWETRLKGAMGVQNLNEFDWGAKFKENYQQQVEIGRIFDRGITDAKNWLQAPVVENRSQQQSSGVQQYGDNYYIDGMKIEIREGETPADAFNRTLQSLGVYR